MLKIMITTLMTLGALGAQPLPSEAHLQEQIKKYEFLTRDNPKDVEFWADLADLYRQAEQWDKAIAADTQAVTRFPKYAVAFYGRGKAKVGKEDYKGSIDDFSAAIKLWESRGGLEMYLTLEQPSGEYIDCYRSRGVAQAHLNKYPEAVADVSIAIKLRKDDPKLLYERGYLEEKAGRKNEAIPDYQRAGLLYADGFAKQEAQECIAHLDNLGAKAQADQIRLKLAPKTKKTDLP
jgi:tetratricopeptide (TPR) repeat protein